MKGKRLLATGRKNSGDGFALRARKLKLSVLRDSVFLRTRRSLEQVE